MGPSLCLMRHLFGHSLPYPARPTKEESDWTYGRFELLIRRLCDLECSSGGREDLAVCSSTHGSVIFQTKESMWTYIHHQR